MRQCSCPLVIGRVRTTLRRAAQSLQRTEPASAKPIASGTLAQLESTEPVASTLPPVDGAPAPAQQSDGSGSARAVRVYLGITPHSSVLSRALPIRNQVVVRGEQLQRERRCHSTREEQHLHHQAMDLRRQGHGSQSTMSRCVRSELTFRLSTRHLDCRKRAAVNKKNAGKVPLM